MMIIRPFTIVSGMMFVLSGAMMFVVKHQSQALDSQVSDINQATTQDVQGIRVLQAQWALEADPSRLAALATQFTGLQPMKPGQLMTMAALGTSLPAPGAKPPGSNPEDPVPALPQLAAAVPVPATASVPVQTAAAATVPAAVQTAAIVPSAVAAPVARPAPVHVASVSESEIAPVAPVVPHHHVVPERVANVVHHVSAPRREMGSSVYLAAASGPAPVHAMPMGAQLVPVRAVARPAPVDEEDGGSLLGMAQGGSQ
jgi:hypothetical protein